MALQSAANMAERLELFDGKIAAICQHRIQARRRVTLGEHKAIAIGLVRVGRIDIHFLKVQIRHDVGSTERSTRVSRLGRVNRSHDTLPDLIGDLRQLWLVIRIPLLRTTPAPDDTMPGQSTR